MGFRFRNSVKVAPGIRLNLGKKSASISVGNKYHHSSISTSGRRTSTTSIPGTGISHVSSSSGKSGRRSRATRPTRSYQKPASYIMLKVCSVIMFIVGAIALFIAIAAFSTMGAAGIIFLVFAVICLFFGWMWWKASKQTRK